MGLPHETISPVAAVKHRGGRARAAANQGNAARPEQFDRYAMVPSQWHHLAIAPLLSILIGVLETFAFPPLAPFLMLLAASGFFYFGKRVHAWELEGDRGKGPTAVIGGAVTVLPSLLTGFALAFWMFRADLHLAIGGALLICASAFASALMSRRPIPLVVCKVALWGPLAVVDMTGVSAAALGIMIGGGAAIAFLQVRFDRSRATKVEIDARVQTRSIDILRDYEETGLGWFWETQADGKMTYISDPLAERLGVTKDDLLGRSFMILFDPDVTTRDSERTINFHLSARSPFHELPIKAAPTYGSERWWSVSGRPIFDSFENFCGFRGFGTDLTEQRRSQEQASRLAMFDSLTGLANRHQMSQTLEKILQARQVHGRACSLLMLDLDRFKHVNDTMGHPAGDALLGQVAHRLENAVGSLGRVGRLGGDEFKVILPGAFERDRLATLAKEIIHSLSQPYSIDGQRVVIGASIGIALAPENGTESEELIRNVDLALYAAKERGRGRYHFYSPDLHSAAEERSQLEQELRDAISTGGLELYYQPVVETATEQIAGFEALLRWTHPVRGNISPDKFIPIAEDTGLIQSIGDWALRTACADLAKWPEEVRCAVNVSPLQFANPKLPAIIASALAHSGVDPSRLELEITESVFLSDDTGTETMFAALKKLGVRLALDDFGTGYSSLGYLRNAPFDKIKIDQSFVRGATIPGSRNGAIIQAITSLAHALGMDTTAEGVETLDELDLVRMQGCSHVQGYIYAKPLSAQAAGERLATGLAAVARGPRSSRPPRQTMLRKVRVRHEGNEYDATIRNISVSGAMLEGLWNVPPGTEFEIVLSPHLSLAGVSRWSEENRLGVHFHTELTRHSSGTFVELMEDARMPRAQSVRRVSA
ncbi:EAL domain-containing protein [Erythrobacter sp. 3-20A1M]|uniref:EAL domain-containing protein n=1 Tax=Erythrobacter sp. 3-20A1M TaxID=2653850 RepID=UPI00352FF35A